MKFSLQGFCLSPPYMPEYAHVLSLRSARLPSSAFSVLTDKNVILAKIQGFTPE